MTPRTLLAGLGDERKGCGPLIAPLSETTRPLRQQVFDRVRAAGLIPRVQVAKELGVSPASVTTITQELIEAGLIEEASAPREGDQGRGRPAVALCVRSSAHLVAGMKLSDREHTAVVVDFSGRPGLHLHIPFTAGSIGGFDTQLTYEFFQGFVNHAGVTLHIDNLKGINAHHQCETVFKAFARALRAALERDPRAAGMIPSTKGSL